MAVVGFVAAAAVTLGRGWPPLASVHDERGILLAADTYAHGRLTNPAPPLSEHFETFHVLVRPSYASKYPPAQGLMLALGQVLTGAPIVGVWLSTAIFCASLTWMLQGWFRTRWALWGSALILVMLAGSSDGTYWLHTYWGGTVAATGAALTYGSVRRITRSPSAVNAVLFALGLGILALSRPFEGGLVAIPALVVAGRWLLSDVRTTLSWRLRRVVAPFALVMASLGAFTLFHNWRVTGHALRLPYLEYEAQYSDVPPFIFSRKEVGRPIEYSNDEMRRFYAEYAEARRKKLQSASAFVRSELERVAEIKRFLAPGLTLILVLLAATSRIVRMNALPLWGSGLVLTGALFVSWYFPHYIAPALAPWAYVLTAGGRRLSLLRPGRIGALLTWFVFAVTAFPALIAPLRHGDAAAQNGFAVRQDSIARSLVADGRRHLVLVSYGSTHDVDEEWVYNRANLTEAPIVWARSLTSEKDARLLAHFRDRVAWRLQVDSAGEPFQLRPASSSPRFEVSKP
jgi:hypothetical protein